MTRRGRAVPVLLAVLLLALACPASAQSIQEILLRAKPAVVLVVAETTGRATLACGADTVTVEVPPIRETGTAWFAAPSGWLVTDARAVASARGPDQALRAQAAASVARPGCRTVDVALAPAVHVVLANGQRLPATIARYRAPAAAGMSGQALALLKVEARDMPTLPLAEPGAAKIGDRLHVIAFPTVVLGHELLSMSSANVEATVTSGAVSGFRQDRAGRPIIETDAPVAAGASGAPAISDDGEVVGTLMFVTSAAEDDGSAVQGFNFAVPAGTIRAFLEGSGADVGAPSAFDEAWRTGLRHFFARRPARAEAAFERASQLLPGLPDLRRVRAENAERLGAMPRRRGAWLALGAAMTGIGAVGYAVLLAARLRRNSFRIRPVELARLLETSPDPPVVLDVRDPGAYARSPVRLPRSLHVDPKALENGRAGLRVEPTRTVVAYCT